MASGKSGGARNLPNCALAMLTLDERTEAHYPLLLRRFDPSDEMNRIIGTARAVAKVARRQHYSRNHLRVAKGKHEKLEKAYGPPNTADRARCDACADEVLGHAKHAPWLYVCAHVAGECVVPNNSGENGELCSLRSLNSVLFDQPEFRDIPASLNGILIGRDGGVIYERRLVETLFQDSDQVIVKSDGSQSGAGVRVVHRLGFDAARVRVFGPGLFQRFTRQHRLFERLGNCPAVATLRCHARTPLVRCIGWDMTVDHEGGVQILEWNGGHRNIKFTEATQGPCFADLGWTKLRRPGADEIH
jgi:hypothetical protein